MSETNFIAGQDGSVVKYDPGRVTTPTAKRKPLTRHQRATLYFTALRYIEKLFRKVGFDPITAQSTGSFTLELGSFILEMKVEQPSPMVHVTSHRDYVYSKDKINAKVTNILPVASGEYVIRVIGTLPSLRSCPPVYAVVDAESSDPLKDAFMHALTAAKSVIEQDPATLQKIKEALAHRNIADDFESFRAEEKQIGE